MAVIGSAPHIEMKCALKLELQTLVLVCTIMYIRYLVIEITEEIEHVKHNLHDKR